MLAPPLRLPLRPQPRPAPSAGLLQFLRHQSERLFATDVGCGRQPDDSIEATCRRGSIPGTVAPAVGRALDPVTRACARTKASLQTSIGSDTLVPATAHTRWRAGGGGASRLGRARTGMAPFSTTRPTRSMMWPRRPDTPQKPRLNNNPTTPGLGSPFQAAWYDRLRQWQWAWQRKKMQAESDPRDFLLPGDLPDHGGNSEFASVMFNTRRLQTAKAALEPRLRCTEVDENGEVILVDGEFKKTELIAKYGLLPRDLRKIDSSNLPHILVRSAAILLNLLHLKVLIKADRVLLFDVYGSKTSYPQSAFMYDLQGRLQQKQPPGAVGGLPYEFRALEAVLLSVTSELEADFDTVREPVIRILTELEADITRDKLRVLLVLSKKVNTFEQKAKLVRDAIEELLEADDDLAAMYLTEKKHELFRGQDDHTEVEMLLESYHKICDEVAQEAGSLVLSIRNTEEIIRAILDANRNALMLLELKFSIGTLGLAMGTFLAGLYGMNLENYIEETNWGFGAVTGVSIAFSIIVCWYGLIKLRKVQRVKMHSPAGTTRNIMTPADWNSAFAALPPGMSSDPLGNAPLDARSRERLQRLGVKRDQLTGKKFY